MIDASHYAERSIIFARASKRRGFYTTSNLRGVSPQSPGLLFVPEEASSFVPIDLRVPLYPSGEFSAALKSPFQPASWTSYLHAASINLCPSPSLHVTRPRTKARIEIGKGKRWLHVRFSGARFKTLFSAVIPLHCYVTQDAGSM